MFTDVFDTVFAAEKASVHAGSGAGENLGLSDKQILELCAAPAGAQVTLAWKTAWEEGESDPDEEVPLGLHVVVKRPDLIASANEFIIHKEPGGRLAMYFKLIDFNQSLGKEFEGIGGELVQRVVSAADAFDLVRLRLFAAGGRTAMDRVDGTRWRGYAAWPKYGFDMHLYDTDDKEERWKIANQFPHQPQELKMCESVLQVCAIKPLGSDFWKICGDGDYMEFDLRSGPTRSRRALAAWKATRKGKDMTKSKTVPPEPKTDVQAAFSGAVAARSKKLGRPVSYEGMLAPVMTSRTAESARRLRAKRRGAGAEIPAHLE